MTTGTGDKPKTLDEAYAALKAQAEGESPPATTTPAPKPEAGEETGDDLIDAEGDQDPLTEAADKAHDPEAVPPWIKFPAEQRWKIPPYKQIYFLKFKAAWTDNPNLGDRTLIFWALTDAEEKLAAKRTRGDSSRTIPEMAKACIRAMGSNLAGAEEADLPMTMADWTGKLGPGNVDRFWNEIGAKCRVLVQNIYLRTHSLSAEETADFFLNCLAVRSAVVG